MATNVAASTRPRILSRVGLDWLFAAPAILALAFFSVPMVALAWRATSSGELGKNITSDLVLDSLRLSAITSTVTLLVAIMVGTPLAYVLARRQFRGKIVVDMVLDLPIVLPPTVAGVALLVTLGRRGVIGETLDASGLQIAFTTAAVVLAQLFVSAPFYIRTVKAGFEAVEPVYEGVASTLGASPLRTFWRVTLPLAWPSVVAGSILCWARALSELGATLIFAGNLQGETQTMPLAIISAFESGRSINVPIALSVILVALIPFWLGLRYLNTPTGHRALLEAIVIGGLVYTFPALLEIRISPQLHTWVYGFFPSDFIQQMRAGGFRPMVFLNHGLMLGIYFCMAIISAAVLYREARREGRTASGWLAAVLWMTLVLILAKSLGALVLAVVFTASVFMFGRRVQVWLGLVVAVVVILYPMLRGAGWIPVNTAYDLAAMVSEDRAASLKFRLDNEDALLAKANLKPVTGWGSWGRNALYDPESGQMTSVTDGIWLIYIGVYGWLGYIGRFGLLTAPILLYAIRRKSFGPSYITPGLIMVLSALLVDLLPNAALVNYVWLMAGAVAGIAVWRPAAAAAPVASAATDDTGDAAPALSGGLRASWLMAEAAAPTTGRRKRSDLQGSRR